MPASADLGSSSDASSRLIAAIQELSLARDLEAVQAIVRRAARELTGADGATFVLREGGNCFYADEDAIAPLWKGRRFPLETCISGWTMLNRAEVVIEDIYVDARIPQDAYRPTFVKSLAMVPIRSAAPIGAIGNYWASPHRATAEEVRLLRLLADSTSIAIENVQLYEERARTERLRALGKMAASVTHDLKNILNPLGLQLQLVRRRVERDPAGVLPVIDQMNEVLKLGNEVLERLRLFSKSDGTVPVEPVDLAEAASNALEICRPRIRDNPKLEVRLEPMAASPARLQKSELVSALVNLVVNACEAMTDGGAIVLRNGHEPNRTWVEVEDDGPGIPAHIRDRIFEPFFTTKETGTGLGLAIVAQFAQKSGGSVQLESEPDRGTRIRLEFPALPA